MRKRWQDAVSRTETLAADMHESTAPLLRYIYIFQVESGGAQSSPQTPLFILIVNDFGPNSSGKSRPFRTRHACAPTPGTAPVRCSSRATSILICVHLVVHPTEPPLLLFLSAHSILPSCIMAEEALTERARGAESRARGAEEAKANAVRKTEALETKIAELETQVRCGL